MVCHKLCTQKGHCHSPSSSSLAPSGLSPHELRPNAGAPVLLLRNLDPPKLCNGTTFIIKTLMQIVLEATILIGKESGEDVFIPKIPDIPSDTQIDFKRLQFPPRLSFTMSINKAQGQTMEVVRFNLAVPVFSHGRSRVGNPENLFLYAPNGKTKIII
uniref:DNA helicase Pif1-like 2B domain-containing protein n=1 Tax=Octopus bimaculoides TaxID=37653 RepID=A0A0L8IHT3_OCTBM